MCERRVGCIIICTNTLKWKFDVILKFNRLWKERFISLYNVLNHMIVKTVIYVYSFIGRLNFKWRLKSFTHCGLKCNFSSFVFYIPPFKLNVSFRSVCVVHPSIHPSIVIRLQEWIEVMDCDSQTKLTTFNIFIF